VNRKEEKKKIGIKIANPAFLEKNGGRKKVGRSP